MVHHVTVTMNENKAENDDIQWDEPFDTHIDMEKFKEMGTSWNKTRSVTWIGGEPLLRKDLIEKGKKYFAHNLIVTNGLITFFSRADLIQRTVCPFGKS